MRESLYNLDNTELKSLFSSLKQPSFRVKQILDWMYGKCVSDFDGMGNIPHSLKASLAERYSLELPEVVHTIGSPSQKAVKFAFRSGDDLYESVILFAEKRRTLCVSSQIGCALGCRFCETAKLGFVRNLTVSEIIGQVIRANQYLLAAGEKVISNIVFMGMGEALSNFENFKKVLSILTSESMLSIGTRKITVSTAGVVHNIQKLIDHKINIGLAISLNASSDDERSEIMPINDRYPITVLLKVARSYADFRGRPITFEYVVIAGKNDSTESAQQLITLLRNFPCKVNLIPLNDCTTDGLHRPEEAYIDLFSKKLHDGGITVTVRRSGAQDIDGACGQLAGKLSSDYQKN